MRIPLRTLVVLGCLGALVLACYGPALLAGRQFAYRDAAHYYYPLYERVQAEWEKGRWPLWEPEENGGMPLLGNPTAAVLYPGKVVYAIFSYPWAARLYIVAHTLIACGGAYVLLRSWDTSVTGSMLGALSYAFGVPVLFQYCNVIFLVGAAWLPWGLRATDRWLRLGRRGALLELAIVLAFEALGGDPEVAYMTGLCAGGYALGLAWLRGRPKEAPAPRLWPIAFAGAGLAVAWVVLTLLLAWKLPALRPMPKQPPPRAFPWMPYVPPAVAAAWGLVGLVLLARWRRSGPRAVLGPMLLGLAAAGLLAGALAAAQLVPVAEFTGLTARAAGEGPHDIYPFSLAPIRLVELVWPNPFGTNFAGNRNWLPLVPQTPGGSKIWVPSLYLGGSALVFALAALGFRNGPPWRAWLSAIALVCLFAALGETTSPLWWARYAPQVRAYVGPHDPSDVTSIRQDLWLRDGDGSFYWFLATVVPGFRQFRYPSKLLSFTALAVAGLAGIGWDRTATGRNRRAVGLATGAIGLSAVAFVAAWTQHGAILRELSRRAEGFHMAFGPIDCTGALAETLRSLLHAALVSAALLVLLARLRREGLRVRHEVFLLVLASADLALANARYVLTAPQSLFETRPDVARRLAEAEQADPSPGPYRVHRVPIWEPPRWYEEASPRRVLDLVEWERATIQPKYGLKYGIDYTRTLGVAELYDHEWFFGPFLYKASAEAARLIGVPVDKRVVVAPRRGYDLWNSRYFVLPMAPQWTDEHRGFASLLPRTERVYPAPDAFEGPGGREKEQRWVTEQDWQIRRNLDAYPRAWVVHSARRIGPVTGLDRAARDQPMQEILYGGDPFWYDPTRVVYDPRTLAWLEAPDTSALSGKLSGARTLPSEAVTFSRYEPQRVELDASLDSPGLVILSDVFYPGWTLTIDGNPAPIYRANRMMRGAVVPSGKHHLIYTYDPRSFRVGGAITLGALVAFAVLCIAARRWPVEPRVVECSSGA
ncbi:MAG: hypothetical protein P4L84_05585 [Isosphaeraceae bacterium]|nr:hypothetical protein [Isosphaeraceae bacterium]